jgi:DNA-binding CsgD family transcriptional regulator
MPFENLECIEEAFAEAALDPLLWVKALTRVATVTNSYGAILLPVTGRIISAVAEARLAAVVASGESLERSAERLGIAKETSRSQLKSIFAKTGCHRHSELVAVLSTFLKDGR